MLSLRGRATAMFRSATPRRRPTGVRIEPTGPRPLGVVECVQCCCVPAGQVRSVSSCSCPRASFAIPLPPALVPGPAFGALSRSRALPLSPRRAYAAPSKQPAPPPLAAGGEMFLARDPPDPVDLQPQLSRGTYSGSLSFLRSFSASDRFFEDRPLQAPHVPAHVAFTREQAQKEAERLKQLAAEAERLKDKEKLAMQDQKLRDLEAKVKEMEQMQHQKLQQQRSRSPMLAVARSAQSPSGSLLSLFPRLRSLLSREPEAPAPEPVSAPVYPPPPVESPSQPVAAPQPEAVQPVEAPPAEPVPPPVEATPPEPTAEEIEAARAAEAELKRAQEEAERRLQSLRRGMMADLKTINRLFNERQRQRLAESRPNLHAVHVRAILTQFAELLNQADSGTPLDQAPPTEGFTVSPAFQGLESPADERVITLSALPQARHPAARLLGTRSKKRRIRGGMPTDGPVAAEEQSDLSLTTADSFDPQPTEASTPAPPAAAAPAATTPATLDAPAAAPLTADIPAESIPTDLSAIAASLESTPAMRHPAGSSPVFKGRAFRRAEAAAFAATNAKPKSPRVVRADPNASRTVPVSGALKALRIQADGFRASAVPSESPRVKKARPTLRGAKKGAAPQADVAEDLGEFVSLLRESNELKSSFVPRSTPEEGPAPTATPTPSATSRRGGRTSLSSSRLPSIFPSPSPPTDTRSFHSFSAALRRAFSTSAQAPPPPPGPKPDADGDTPVPPFHKPATHRAGLTHGDRARRGHSSPRELKVNPAVSRSLGATNPNQAGVRRHFVPLDPDSFRLQTVHSPPAARPVPELAQELRAVLHNQGTHATMPLLLSQQRLSFSPYFSHIRQPEEIDFRTIPPFVSCSRDMLQIRLARKSECTLMASTSSSTSLLNHIYFLFSNFSNLDLRAFGSFNKRTPSTPFAFSARMAVSVVLRNRGDGLWGMDSHPKYDAITNKILVELGKTMERMATMEPDEFERLMLKTPMLKTEGAPDMAAPPSLRPVREPAVFLKAKHTLFRSQLDAIMNVNGVPFDLKTRATFPIRKDPRNYEHLTDYRIVSAKGKWFSFEREHFDMARTAFLKYIFQCRLGRMGGVMVTYHNTKDVFGYEFISLEQMEKVVYGSSAIGERVFRSAVTTLESVLKSITSTFRDAPAIKFTFHANDHDQCLNMFAEVVPTLTEKWKPVTIKYTTETGAEAEAMLPFAIKSESALMKLLQIDQLSDADLRSLLREMKISESGERYVRLQRLEGHTGRFMRHSSVVPSPLEIAPLIGKRVFKYELRMRHSLNGQPFVGRLVGSGIKPEDVHKLKTQYSFLDVTKDKDRETLAGEYCRILGDTVITTRTRSNMEAATQQASERFEHLEKQYQKLLQNSAELPTQEARELTLDDEVEEARNLSVAVKVALGEDPVEAVPMAAQEIVQAVESLESDEAVLSPESVLAKMVPRS